MDLTQKRLALFDAHLSHKGLQHLVDAAAELLGNPLFMADLSMRIVCKSSDMGEGELDFSAEGDPDRQRGLAKQAADAGFMDFIYHHDQPVIGTFEGQPRYLSARVRDGGTVLGHVVVTEAKRSFETDDEELLPVICQTLSFELRRTRDDAGASEPYGPLLDELLSGSTRDEDEVRRRFADLGHALPGSVRLLLFRPVDEVRMISPTYLHSQLFQAFRGSVGTVRDAECVLVVNGSLSLVQVGERLESGAYTGGLAVGASRPFNELTMLDWAWRQADAALRLSPSTPEGEILSYEEVVAAHLLELAKGVDSRAAAAFEPIELRRLEAFDERDRTDYLRSLAVFLNCGRNVARASRVLHVHKNSMYYRVQRIEELCGIDLSDEGTCFRLQLGLALRGMGPSSGYLE